SLVLRRLRRLAEHYAGASRVRPPGLPGVTFVLASATTADPAASAARLVGVDPTDVVAVTDDTSRAGRKTFALWQPPELPGRSPLDAAAALRNVDGSSLDERSLDERAPGHSDSAEGRPEVEELEPVRRTATAEAA